MKNDRNDCSGHVLYMLFLHVDDIGVGSHEEGASVRISKIDFDIDRLIDGPFRINVAVAVDIQR